MRNYGSRITLDINVPSDQVLTFLVAGSSGQAADWPTGTQICRVSMVSTVGSKLPCYVNLSSTKAAAPSSGNTSEGTTGFVNPVIEPSLFQVSTLQSTGLSVAALSSGYIFVECWKKSG